jgi:hypothetical protein
MTAGTKQDPWVLTTPSLSTTSGPSSHSAQQRHASARELTVTVTKVIRYKTHPESADENERLIRDVFAELAERQPTGLHYAAFRLDDGVTFIHVAVIDGAANPLSVSAAFGKFQAGIQDRCIEGPAAADAAIVGSYQFMPE